jgi:transposase-like protein
LAAVVSIAEKIGCAPQTLHELVKKADVNSGKRAGVPTEVADKMKALEREVRELRLSMPREFSPKVPK